MADIGINNITPEGSRLNLHVQSLLLLAETDPGLELVIVMRKNSNTAVVGAAGGRPIEGFMGSLQILKRVIPAR